MDKKLLLSFKELKAKAENIQKNSIDDYKDALHFYDIHPKINYDYLQYLKTNKGKNFAHELNRLMYTLNYEIRIKLNPFLVEYEQKLKKIENNQNLKLIQERTTEKMFKDILKLLTTNITFDSFEKSLKSENYIKEHEFKCPFFEGNNEFFFYGLLILLKLYLYDLKDSYNLTDIENENKTINEYGKFNFINFYGTLKQSNFTQITSLAKKIEIAEEDLKNENENKIIINSVSLTKEEIEKIFKIKKRILSEFIKKYLSEEFEKKFNEQYSQISDEQKKIKYKRIYPIYLMQSLILYVGQKTYNKNALANSYIVFYEYEKNKLDIINEILELKYIEIYDNNKKYEYMDKIENKEYQIKFKDGYTNINFYDIIMSNINEIDFMSYDDFTKVINNKENWTLQKYFKDNYLFSKANISKIIENNIFNSIQNNNVFKKAFNAVDKFKCYNYPFENQKIIEQIKNCIFIFPFSCESISGLTLKKFGLILINNRLKPIEKELNLEDWFFVFLLKGMNYKITYIHEINFHYVLYLIYANNYSDSFETPKKLFTLYKIDGGDVGDAGDKGECLLFGKKVNLVYIRAALLLSDDKEYILNENEDFNIIAEKFLKFNMPYTLGDLNSFSKIKEKNSFTLELYNQTVKEIGISPNKKKQKKDLGKHVYVAHKRDNIFKDEFISYDERFLFCLQPTNIEEFVDSD